MGLKMTAINSNYVLAGVAGLTIAYLLYQESKKAVKAVGEAVNPVNSENIFNQGFEAVGEAVTGQEGWSLGVWLADKLNPPEKYSNGVPIVGAVELYETEIHTIEKVLEQ